MFIPWMITTPLTALVSYILTKIGMVSAVNGVMIPWTTPIFLSGYLVSGISGVFLQGLILILCFVIYYPFLKALDAQLLKKEAEIEADKNSDDIDLENFTF